MSHNGYFLSGLSESDCKILFKKIEDLKNNLIALNLDSSEIFYRAAESIVYLDLLGDAYNELLAEYHNLSIRFINHSSLPAHEKETMTGGLITLHQNILIEMLAKRKKDLAKIGGDAKTLLDRDGKQKAKSEVKKWWKKWQINYSMYKSKAAFARAMLDKYDVLENTKVIEDWCREWKNEKCSPAKQAEHPA